VIANLSVALVHVAARVAACAPATVDPDVTATAILPASLLPNVANALALVVAVTPCPSAAVPDPTTLDPDVSGTGVDHDVTRRRWLLLDLDVRDRCADASMGTDDAAGSKQCERAGDG
jgi:hypothetical protein